MSFWFKNVAHASVSGTGPCACKQPPFRFDGYDSTMLGEDQQGAEVSLSKCKRCGITWLMYFIEEPHYSRSGRWWRVEVAPDHALELSALSARQYVENSSAGFAGGSYFNSSGHVVTAPIVAA